mgnify:FL=1
MKNVIFDLDGTLALIDDRRVVSTKPNGKINWDIFFDPKNIDLDKPNLPVIKMAQLLKQQGFRIVILSGRLKTTKDATVQWLKKFDVPFDVIKMRPDTKDFKFMPDDVLKQDWLDQLFPDKSDVLCIFDDRNKVVDMWRRNGLTCFQVAEGNF